MVWRSKTTCTWLLPLLLLMLPTAVQAQFSYVTDDDGTIAITSGYRPSGEVIIPDTIDGLPVTSIADESFSFCTSLIGLYFRGAAPSYPSSVFLGPNNVTVYNLPGATGWGPTFAGRPTAPWHLPYPVILTLPPYFGVQSNQFGFRVSWATNADVVVEAATNLTNPIWVPAGTRTLTMGVDPLTDGWSYFSDPGWTNYPARYYRVVGAPANPDPARLVWIPPGTFTMGSPTNEAERLSNELQHEVTISRGFWMGKYEVTQEDYLEVVGSNPSYFRNGTESEGGTGGPVTNELVHPVEKVTWFEATNYCGLRTERERGVGRLPEGYIYRLATEAEWEYACRAGTTTSHHYGNELRSGMANFDGPHEYDASGGTMTNPEGIFLGRTTGVGSYAPNAWGLYDMHGNVWEWCQDWYGDYPAGPVADPTGPAAGSDRVLRGGCWGDDALLCRSADRDKGYPVDRGRIGYGFRVVLAAGQPGQ